MKTPEDMLKEALGEIRYKLNGTVTNEQLKWALEEYAKLYHKSEVKNLHKPDNSGSFCGCNPPTSRWLDKKTGKDMCMKCSKEIAN